MKAISLCSTHQREDRKTVPQGCPTCRRINIERDIVTRTVSALLKAGCSLSTDANPEMGPRTKRADVLAELMEVDDEHLMVFNTPQPEHDYVDVGWVRFVYGNDGADVISDYTVNLEGVLQPVFDYIRETYE